MKIKRIMLISLLVLALITITAVNAADDNATTETLTMEEPVEVDSADEMLEIQEDEKSNQADEKLAAKPDEEIIQGIAPDIQIRVNDTMVGEDAFISITAPNDATGSVTITVDGNNYEEDLLDGEVSFLIQGLAAGNYLVTATYPGDATYDSGQANTTFRVNAYTFAQLRDYIEWATAGDTLTLDHDYVSDGYPLEINKAITIDGNGHTLDAMGLSAIFDISADDVTLTDLTLMNSYSNSSAIKVTGRNSRILNCTISNCTALSFPGAIYMNGDGGLINITFIINTQSASDSGAVYLNGNDCIINNTIFENCTGRDGGSVYIAGMGNIISECSFINSFADGNGGSVYWNGGYGLLNASTFYHSKSLQDGGAVYWSGSDGLISNSMFNNCSAVNGGAVYGSNHVTVNGTIFANNTATLGGAMYDCDFEDCIIEGEGNQIYPQYDVPILILVNGTLIGANETLDVTFGDEIVLTFLLPHGTPGNLSVFINGSLNDIAIDANGTVSMLLPTSYPGAYNVIVKYPGSAKYLANSTAFIVEVGKAAAIIDITALNIVFGEDETIIVSLPADATGFVNLIVSTGGEDISSNMTFFGNGTTLKTIVYNSTAMITDGIASVPISGLSAGTYTAKAIYPGDDKYGENVSSTMFSVSKCVLGPVEVNLMNNIITITAPDDITGMMTFTFNNINYTVGSNDTVDITGAAPGIYNWILTYPGDEKYYSYFNSSTISVPKWNLKITTSFDDNEGVLTVISPFELTCPLNLTIGDENHLIGTGLVNVDLRNLASGNHTYTVTYPGDELYESFTVSKNITITKTLLAGEVNVTSIERGVSGNITVTLSSNVSGTVNFIVYNPAGDIIINTTSPAKDGRATLEFANENVGSYVVSASFMGNGDYYPGWISNTTFNVMPNMNLPNNITAGFNGNVNMDFGSATGNVKISVDDVEYATLRISGNKINYQLPTDDLPVGKHYMTFDTLGSSVDNNIFYVYNEATGEYEPVRFYFDVTAQKIVIVPQKEEKQVSEKFYEVVVENSQKEVAVDAKGTVTFNVTRVISEYINETFEVVVNVVNGIARLDLSKYPDGEYVISWAYSGDTKYAAASNQVKLSVKRFNPRIVANDLNMLYSSNQVYSVTVYGTDGKVAANTLVTFYINNAKIKAVNTNSHGVASIVISKNPGSYKITSNALGAKVTKNLKVNHVVSLKKVKVKRSAKKLVLTATLKKVNGKYLKGKKVTFKFNGKKLTAKTNKKGVAKVTVKKKFLKKLKKGKKVTYSATYLKDTVKVSVKVKK